MICSSFRRTHTTVYFFGELEEVGGSLSWGFNRVDELKEGPENICGCCHVDYGEVVVTPDGLSWLSVNEERVIECGRRDGIDELMSTEILEHQD